MKIFIPLICYNRTCNADYMLSTIEFSLTAKEKGLDIIFYPILNESLISRARNACVANMIESGATHLLFIDADLTYNYQDVMKLLKADKGLICGMYPLKNVFFDMIKENPGFEYTKFPVETCEYEDDLIVAEYAPTGFMMIKRETILKMMENYPELKYKNDLIPNYGNNDFFYNFFNVGVHGDKYESEDWGFCRLWRQLNEKVYVHPEVNLTHMGWFDFRGNFQKHLTEHGAI